MKRITLLFAVLMAAFVVGLPAAQGHDGHRHVGKVKAQASGWDCQDPNAPDSYRTYGCSSVSGKGENWRWVIGTGKYSNTIHQTKLQRVCIGGYIGSYCLAWRMYAWSHYHS
jgi:hypothetical protein